MKTNKKKDLITPSEFLVLREVVKGFNNNEIARTLYITTHTVKAHLESMYKKTNSKNRVQLVIYAIKNDLIEIHSNEQIK